jgi:hypothetical protein
MVMQRAFVAILAFSSGSLWEAETLPPTAMEVFHLRSECAALGTRIFDDSFVRPNIDRDQVSHYDTKSNRCYVKMDTQTRSPPFVFQRYLYDGQTGKLLATTRAEGDQRSGSVMDRRHKVTTWANDFYDDAKAYIDSRMNEGQR